MLSNYKFGIFAEFLVIFSYKIRFYRLVAHRMRNKFGEIDIICKKNNLLVFIEVKARRYNFDDMLCRNYQINRIKRAAEFYIYCNQQYNNFDIRFDLAMVKPFSWPIIISDAW